MRLCIVYLISGDCKHITRYVLPLKTHEHRHEEDQNVMPGWRAHTTHTNTKGINAKRPYTFISFELFIMRRVCFTQIRCDGNYTQAAVNRQPCLLHKTGRNISVSRAFHTSKLSAVGSYTITLQLIGYLGPEGAYKPPWLLHIPAGLPILC